MDVPVVHIKTGKVEVIQSTDVIFIQAEEDRTVLHTVDQEYRPVDPLKDFAELLMPEGFQPLDKSNVVNMSKIQKYDKITKQAFFDKGGKGKSAKVSRRNQERIKD